MPTGYFDTDSAIGNREDLTDILTNISPTKTPFISNISRTSASGVLHEWQTDVLAAAASAGGNAIAEGASAAPASGSPTTRIGNRTQIFEKIVAVTRTQNRVNHAGRGSEWAYQMEKAMKEMARDVERQAVESSAVAAGDVSANTARQMEGLGAGGYADAVSASANVAGFLSGNAFYGTAASGGAGLAATGRTNLTETLFNNLLQLIWEDGGDPSLIIMGGYNKRVMSAFTGNGTRFNTVANANGKTLSANVRIYESDFGGMMFQESRFINASKLVAIDPQYYALAELEPLFFEELAKTGDRMLGHYIYECTLEARAPESGGILMALASATGGTAAF